MSLDTDDIIPDGDSDDVGGGKVSAGTIDKVANAAYGAGFKGSVLFNPQFTAPPNQIQGLDPAGNPITLSLVLTSTSADQQFVAYATADGTQLIVGNSGSSNNLNWFTDFATWGPNISILPNSDGRELTYDLVQTATFIQDVQTAAKNGLLPGVQESANVTLTGHSLSGAEDQIVGYYTGVSAYVFDAPGVLGFVNSPAISGTMSSFEPAGYNPSTDDVVNVNIYPAGDIVHDVGGAFGTQGEIVSSDPASTLNTQNHWYDALDDHDPNYIQPYLDQVGKPGSTVTIQTSALKVYNADLFGLTIPVATQAPQAKVFTGQPSAAPLAIDPTVADELVFLINGSSTPISELRLPDDGTGIAEFSVAIETNSQWSGPTTFGAGQAFNFPAQGVQAFKIRAFNADGSPHPLPSGYIFFVNFAPPSGSLTPSFSATVKSITPAGNFDGDLSSDLLFRNANGAVAAWQMNGTLLTGGGIIGTNPGPSWALKGSGDFNADGRSDLIWQNNDGTAAIWELNSTSVIGGGVAGSNPGAAWQIKGTGDFNGDGTSDILWQNTDGTVAIWEMHGTSVVGGGVAGSNPGTSWQIKGVGDFNGDGNSDILWQNSDGTVAIWELNGPSVIGGGIVGNPGSTWRAVGAGDFDGDGKSDILWQNNNGQAAIWLMNGAATAGGGLVGSNPGSAWHAIGTGDYNGDQISDILWQNNDGTPAVWLMSGTSVIGGGAVGSNPGTSWHLVAGTG